MKNKQRIQELILKVGNYIAKDQRHLADQNIKEQCFMLAQKVGSITSPTKELKFIANETLTTCTA